MIRHLVSSIVMVSVVTGSAAAQAIPSSASKAITVVLVHGAFAESSSWDGVVADLTARGYPVIAVANPLRSVRADAAYVSSLVNSVNGPVVLVGHSYGGQVISNVASDKVKALVFVAAFAPEPGETCIGLSARFPGSTLGPTLAAPVQLPDGSKDLYIQQDRFHEQFAADVPAATAKTMAAAQRPITEAALNEASGAPLWKGVPSWVVFGSRDMNIPAAAHRFMAERAGSKKTIEVDGASHVVMISNPGVVAELIDQAATAALTGN